MEESELGEQDRREEKGKEMVGTDQIRAHGGEKLGLAPNSELKTLSF